MEIGKNEWWGVRLSLKDIAKAAGSLVVDFLRNTPFPETGYSPTHHIPFEEDAMAHDLFDKHPYTPHVFDEYHGDVRTSQANGYYTGDPTEELDISEIL